MLSIIRVVVESMDGVQKMMCQGPPLMPLTSPELDLAADTLNDGADSIGGYTVDDEQPSAAKLS